MTHPLLSWAFLQLKLRLALFKGLIKLFMFAYLKSSALLNSSFKKLKKQGKRDSSLTSSTQEIMKESPIKNSQLNSTEDISPERHRQFKLCTIHSLQSIRESPQLSSDSNNLLVVEGDSYYSKPSKNSSLRTPFLLQPNTPPFQVAQKLSPSSHSSQGSGAQSSRAEALLVQLSLMQNCMRKQQQRQAMINLRSLVPHNNYLLKSKVLWKSLRLVFQRKVMIIGQSLIAEMKKRKKLGFSFSLLNQTYAVQEKAQKSWQLNIYRTEEPIKKKSKQKISRFGKLLAKKVSLILFDALCCVQLNSKVKTRPISRNPGKPAEERQPETKLALVSSSADQTKKNAFLPTFGDQEAKVNRNKFLQDITKQIDEFTQHLNKSKEEYSVPAKKGVLKQTVKLNQPRDQRWFNFSFDKENRSELQNERSYNKVDILPITKKGFSYDFQQTPIKRIHEEEGNYFLQDRNRRKINQIDQLIKRIKTNNHQSVLSSPRPSNSIISKRQSTGETPELQFKFEPLYKMTSFQDFKKSKSKNQQKSLYSGLRLRLQKLQEEENRFLGAREERSPRFRRF